MTDRADFAYLSSGPPLEVKARFAAARLRHGTFEEAKHEEGINGDLLSSIIIGV